MAYRGYSKECPDLTTYWHANKCVSCPFEPGHEITPNCGFDDHGGRHVPLWKKCQNDTFNDGSTAYCRPCTVCGPEELLDPCNATTDTRCSVRVTTVHPTTRKSYDGPAVGTKDTGHIVLWTVPLAVLCLLLVLMFFFWAVRRKGQRRPSYVSVGFSPLSAPASRTVEETLDPAILSAPLQTTLNDLDVVEELMILLDPETQGLKNTKHLASHCGFSSAWITYAYSMRDSKSPLKAVLEGVTSREPDWTVGDMVRMLRLMERNDAISVLARLRPGLVDA